MGNVDIRIAKLDCVTKRMFINFKGRDYEFTVCGENNNVGTGAISAMGKIFEWEFTWYESNPLPSFTLREMISAKDKFEDVYSKPDVSNPITFKVQLVNGGVEDYFGITFLNGFMNWFQTYGEIIKYLTLSGKYNVTIFDYIKIKEWAFEFEKLHKGRFWDGDWLDEVHVFTEKKLETLKN